jgi:hypothetical protein
LLSTTTLRDPVPARLAIVIAVGVTAIEARFVPSNALMVVLIDDAPMMSESPASLDPAPAKTPTCPRVVPAA